MAKWTYSSGAYKQAQEALSNIKINKYSLCNEGSVKMKKVYGFG